MRRREFLEQTAAAVYFTCWKRKTPTSGQSSLPRRSVSLIYEDCLESLLQKTAE